MSQIYLDRIARVRQAMEEQGVDVLMLSVGHDLPYLTGYLAMPLERLTMLVLPREGDASLIIPRLEVARVEPQPGVFDIVPWDETDDPTALAAKLAGCTDLKVLALHIFPNALPPMMVQVSLNLGWAILNAAGLSFIGLGVRPPTPEWGIMVAEGAGYIISGEWWLALFPGLWLMMAVFTFNLLGDGLRDMVDPRQRR